MTQDLERQDRVHVLEITGRRISGSLWVNLSDLTIHPEPPEPAPTSAPSPPNGPLTRLSPTAPEVDDARLKALCIAVSLSPEEVENALF